LDQEKLPNNPSGGEKREEPFRRATEEDPSPGWTDAIDRWIGATLEGAMMGGGVLAFFSLLQIVEAVGELTRSFCNVTLNHFIVSQKIK